MKELNEKPYYEGLLDNNIHHWAIDNQKQPSHIIVHPNMWQYIGSELGLHGRNDWVVNKYKGLKVYRSFDIDEDKFEIG